MKTTLINIITLCGIFILGVSCGPRTGIHEDKESQSIDSVTETTTCGNAMIVDTYSGISGDVYKGKTLFKQNCAVCHSIGDMRIIGPGLQNVYNRIPEPKGPWLKNYILNSTKVYLSGDAYAKKLRKEYPKDSMTVFEGTITDEEVNDIVVYILGSTR